MTHYPRWTDVDRAHLDRLTASGLFARWFPQPARVPSGCGRGQETSGRREGEALAPSSSHVTPQPPAT
jgi:hypothetical protein